MADIYDFSTKQKLPGDNVGEEQRKAAAKRREQEKTEAINKIVATMRKLMDEDYEITRSVVCMESKSEKPPAVFAASEFMTTQDIYEVCRGAHKNVYKLLKSSKDCDEPA